MASVRYMTAAEVERVIRRISKAHGGAETPMAVRDYADRLRDDAYAAAREMDHMLYLRDGPASYEDE